MVTIRRSASQAPRRLIIKSLDCGDGKPQKIECTTKQLYHPKAEGGFGGVTDELKVQTGFGSLGAKGES